MARRLLIKKILELFRIAGKQTWFITLMRLPQYLRILLGCILTLYGIIALISPLPLGALMIIIGLSLALGIRKVKYYLLRFIYFTRLHIIFSRIYFWWKRTF